MDLTQNKTLVPSDPAAFAVAEAARARVQAAYVMALQKPRNEDQARASILAACRRPGFAEKLEYSKPVGSTRVKGPSIRFAELALSHWSNILTESFTVFEDDRVRRVRIMVCDLETNASFSKEITITKTVERKSAEGREVLGERKNSKGEKTYIVEATDEELANKEAALISKAIRNEGLRLIPSDIIEEGLAIARETKSKQDAEDPAAAKKRVLDAFSDIGIQPKHLGEYLGHSLDYISAAELGDLRSVYQAIRDGEASWADYMQIRRGQEAPEASEAWEEFWPQILPLALQKGLPENLTDNLREFITKSAVAMKLPISEVLKGALTEFEGLWVTYLKWPACEYKEPPATDSTEEAAQEPPQQQQPDPGKKKQQTKGQAPNSEQPQQPQQEAAPAPQQAETLASP